MWSMDDLLSDNKCPEFYDSIAFHNWDFNEITDMIPLDGRFVIEGGAGTDRETFRLSHLVKEESAVEPAVRLHQFIRENAIKKDIHNILTLDERLHSVPLPYGLADVFLTSHALGWNLKNELSEFERVVRPGGTTIHGPGIASCA